MLKRLFLIAVVAVVAGAGFVATAPEADAGIVFGRVAPVRRAAARVALPPYPVARRTVVGPVYRPYYPAYRPMIYRTPAIYAPGVTVWGY